MRLQRALTDTMTAIWDFFAPRPAPGAIRTQLFPAAVSLVALALSCLVFGPQLGIIGMMGAFVPFWESGRPFWARVRAGLLVTVSLCICMALGVLVAPHSWAVIPACLLVIVVAGMIYQTFLLTTGPTPAMMFYAAAIGTFFGAHADIGWRMVEVTAFSAGVASLLLLIPVIFQPHAPIRSAISNARTSVNALSATSRDDQHTARNAAAESVAFAGLTLGSAWPAHRTLAHRELRAELEDVTADFVSELTDEATSTHPKRAPRRPHWMYLLRRAFRNHSLEWFVTWRMALAAGIAGIASTLLGSNHPYWAIITATIVLNQWADPRTSIMRAARRTVGTLIGVGITELVMTLHPSAAVSALLVMLAILAMYLFLPANYALALIAITPMALIANATSTGWQDSTALDRMLDTTLAAIAAVLVMWISGWGFPKALVVAQSKHLLAAAKVAQSKVSEHGPLELLYELTRHQNVLERARSGRSTPKLRELVTLEHAAAERGYEALADTWPDSNQHKGR